MANISVDYLNNGFIRLAAPEGYELHSNKFDKSVSDIVVTESSVKHFTIRKKASEKKPGRKKAK